MAKRSGFMKKLLLLGLAILLALTSSTWPVQGATLGDLQKEQDRINKQIDRHQQQIRQTNTQIKSLSRQMQDLEESIEKTESDLEDLRVELQAAQQRVTQAEDELNAAEKALADRTDVFRIRLKEIYQNGQVDFLEVLLQSTDMTDFLVRMDLLQKIAEQDMQLLQSIETQRAEVAAKKTRLEQQRDQVSKLKKSTEDKQQRLSGDLNSKEKLADRLRTQKEDIEQALAEEEEASRQIASKIRELASKTGQYVGGKMAWPLPGFKRITSDFGYRVHPILKTKKYHDGIDIAAPSGSKIIAAQGGKVLMARWFGAYGNAVVIDHGGKITTLYGHMSKILVKEGQQVDRGGTIGLVGSTGLSTGPHLHFSVRENGDPVSPWNYVR